MSKLQENLDELARKGIIDPVKIPEDVRIVYCINLKTESEGLACAPYPGELGKKIYENISKIAWNNWLKYQTMLINENRLTVADPKHRKYLMEEMNKFLFEGVDVRPAEYVPPKEEK